MKKPPPPAVLAPDDTPEGKRKRREQLRNLIERIREAEFPRDYRQFLAFVEALRSETSEGRRVQVRWRNHVAQGGSVPGLPKPAMDCPPAIFLPSLQADLAGATVRHWNKLTTGLRSPKRTQAANEPVPAKAAALFAEAEQEEERAVARIRDEGSGIGAYRMFCDGMDRVEKTRPKRIDPKTRQKRAHHKQDYTPTVPSICAWSKPMTQADYVNATAHNRKTIERFLSRIKAHSDRRRHAAEAGRYSVDVNLKVLAHWIGSWLRDKKHASGLAAATIAWAHFHDQSFENEVNRVLFPILERRNLMNSTFADDLEAHQKLYGPPSDPFMSLALISALNA